MTQTILDFIGYTDFAAAIKPSYHCPGAAKVAGYLNYLRQGNPEGTFVLDAGDILCGAPIINLTHGEPVVEIVNLFNYDAMTLGNHEFDNGKEIMTRTLSRATFPLLCANIIDKETGELIDFVRPYIILEKLGVRVGILGVTTAYTPLMVKADSFRPYEVLDPAVTCNHYIPLMRQEGAEIIVVLGHLPGKQTGEGQGEGELFEVARAVAGIDILFGGHNVGGVATTVNGAIVSKTGHSAVSLGHVRVAYDRQTKRVTCLKNEIVPIHNGNLPVEEDARVKEAVANVMAPYEAVLGEVLGVAEEDLVVSNRDECALGNFFADSIKEVCDAQIGLLNSTSCFGYMPAGPITTEMIMWVMCFNDNFYRGRLSGKQIREMLERTYLQDHIKVHGSLQLSGLRVTLDSSREPHDRIVALTLDDGTALEDDAQYLIGTSAYIASGGNGYHDIVAQTEWEQTEHMTHPVLVEQMRQRKRLSAATEGRIVDLADGAEKG